MLQRNSKKNCSNTFYGRIIWNIMCIIFVKSFFAISLQHGTVMYIYPSMDAAVCLEIETLLAYDRVLKNASEVLKKSWIFL